MQCMDPGAGTKPTLQDGTSAFSSPPPRCVCASAWQCHADMPAAGAPHLSEVGAHAGQDLLPQAGDAPKPKLRQHRQETRPEAELRRQRLDRIPEHHTRHGARQHRLHGGGRGVSALCRGPACAAVSIATCTPLHHMERAWCGVVWEWLALTAAAAQLPQGADRAQACQAPGADCITRLTRRRRLLLSLLVHEPQDLAAGPQLGHVQQLQPEVLDPDVLLTTAHADALLHQRARRGHVGVVVKLPAGGRGTGGSITRTRA